MDATLFQAIVLGIVQGLSEFLPISSSGHLVLVPWLLGWDDEAITSSLTFDLALHLGTSAALLGYFWRDWLTLIQAVLAGTTNIKARQSHEWRLAWLILIGCIPAGIMGVLFEDYIERTVRQPPLIAALLIIFGIVLFIADRVGRRDRELKAIHLWDAVIIGLAQILALAPGVSRSGITMTAGLFQGLDRSAAARYSFLLSAPITIAAALYKLRVLIKEPLSGSDAMAFVVGAVVAGVVGALAIGFMLRYIQRQPLDVFVWWRLLFGAFCLTWAFLNGV